MLANDYRGSLISLMHANNEIGTLNDIAAISKIARSSSCYFHSDTVQTMGHYRYDLSSLDIDFITCSAHKFHGPKGVGFLYKNQRVHVKPIITGGGQESKMRAGTENLVSISGLAKALEIAYSNLDADIQHIQSLKSYTWKSLKSIMPDLRINGAENPDMSLYTVLNVSLPPSDTNSTLLYQLDIDGICVSGGSACNSGALGESHVLEGIQHPEDRAAIRISFSKFNEKKEVDLLVKALQKLVAVAA
jgi:cysteine desulfurase